MDVFPELLKTPWVQIVGWTLGGIGWIIGIVSGLIQLRSYYEQKRLEKGYVSILEQAKRDWEGRYTEEQVNSLTQELTRLQEAIHRDVPQQAKQVFLEEQLQDISGDIGRLYSRYAQLSQGLSEQGASGVLPSSLREAIEETIMPNYLARQRQQRAIYRLLIVLLVLTLSSTLLPWFYERIVILGVPYPPGWILLFGLIVLVMGYVLHSLAGHRIAAWAKRPSLFRPLSIGLSWIVSMFFLRMLVGIGGAWVWEWESRGSGFATPVATPVWGRVVITSLVALVFSLSLLLSYYALEDRLVTPLQRLKRNG